MNGTYAYEDFKTSMINETITFANNASQQANGPLAATLILLAGAYLAAIVFTFAHCVIRCENEERVPYAFIILALPVLGAFLYWKDRPDIYGYAILMAYPPSPKEPKEKKAKKPAAASTANPVPAPRFSSPPFQTKAQPPRYSSHPFNLSAAKSKQDPRTSNTSSPFLLAKYDQSAATRPGVNN